MHGHRLITKTRQVRGQGRCLRLDILLIGNASLRQKGHGISGQVLKFRIGCIPAQNGHIQPAGNGVVSAFEQAVDEGRARVLCREGRAVRIAALLAEQAPETLLFEILHPLGFNESQTEDIFRSLKGQAGKRFTAGDWEVVKDRDLLLIEQRTTVLAPVLDIQTFERGPGFVVPRDKSVACLDADKLSLPLSLRLWQKGDCFVPLGMKGKKKVSDYLTDRKFSLLQKERQWVLCMGEDIVWLVGERIDHRFRVDESTRRVTLVRIVR